MKIVQAGRVDAACECPVAHIDKVRHDLQPLRARAMRAAAAAPRPRHRASTRTP
jgi:hypothetical protein